MGEGGWITKAVRGSYGVGLWKEIFKEDPHLKLNSSLVLGDGSRITFQEDAWCNKEPLCELFLALCAG